jgi:hypothetical protein
LKAVARKYQKIGSNEANATASRSLKNLLADFPAASDTLPAASNTLGAMLFRAFS